MNKLALLLLTNLIALFSFSQSSQVYDQALKDYEIQNVISWQELDEETMMLTAQINKKGMIYLMLFKISYNAETNQYSGEKLDHTHYEVYKNMNPSYYKNKGKIYRLIDKESKGEVSFFSEELKGNRFQESEKPFFKGNTDYVGLHHLYKSKDGKSLFLTTQKLVKSKVESFTVTEFGTEDLDFISTGKTIISKEKETSSIYSMVQDGSLISNFLYREDGISQLGYIVFADGKMSEFNFDQPYSGIIVYSMFEHGGLFMSVLNLEAQNLSLGIYTVDARNHEITKADQVPISKELLNTDYDASESEHSIKKSENYHFYKVLTDANGDSYLFFQIGAIIKMEKRDVYATSDILVFKVSGGKIIWSKCVRRYTRTQSDKLDPEITLNDGNISIADYESAKAFDDNGKYITQYKRPVIIGLADLVQTEITLDKQTGEISRKLLKTK